MIPVLILTVTTLHRNSSFNRVIESEESYINVRNINRVSLGMQHLQPILNVDPNYKVGEGRVAAKIYLVGLEEPLMCSLSTKTSVALCSMS